MNKMREEFEAWIQFHPMGEYIKAGYVWFDDIINKYQSKSGTSQASNQMQVMFEAWQAAAERHQPKWISCADELPKSSTWVLASTVCFGGCIAKQLFFEVSDHGEIYWLDGIKGEWPDEVTHWMPLPAPKEQSND